MKTVSLFRDFDYDADPRKTVRFHGGVTYTRVIEAAATAIVRAGAGRIVTGQATDPAGVTDASHAFQPWRKSP
jgi:hypothetical protein